MDKKQQKKLITEIMHADEKDGLYEPTVSKMETTQTAVEWLIKQVNHQFWGNVMIDIPKEVIVQAKAMEKEQIINAWRNGDNDSMYSPQELDQQAEQYYNETYERQ